MSLYHPAFPAQQIFLNEEPLEFPSISALPHIERLAAGQLYIFRFQNGYGVYLIVTPFNIPNHLELCVMDCSGPQPQPDFGTPVANQVLTGLSPVQAIQILQHTEELPLHPRLVQTGRWLSQEAF